VGRVARDSQHPWAEQVLCPSPPNFTQNRRSQQSSKGSGEKKQREESEGKEREVAASVDSEKVRSGGSKKLTPPQPYQLDQ
jgi:hypothetical protein